MELPNIFDNELFNGLDLEDINIPSLPFQLPFGTDLADEADKSDMTPHCLPVIDPHFVRENLLEEKVMEGVKEAQLPLDHILEEYLTRWDVAHHYDRLHILVCGYCHNVFHVIDEFRSHSVTCSEVKPDTSRAVSGGLALVLWTNTVLRLVRDRNFGENFDHDSLVRRVESKWFRLSKKTKMGWERAATVLLDLVQVGKCLFDKDQLEVEKIPLEIWPGPLDFYDADEIIGDSTLEDNVKTEIVESGTNGEVIEETVVEHIGLETSSIDNNRLNKVEDLLEKEFALSNSVNKPVTMLSNHSVNCSSTEIFNCASISPECETATFNVPEISTPDLELPLEASVNLSSVDSDIGELHQSDVKTGESMTLDTTVIETWDNIPSSSSSDIKTDNYNKSPVVVISLNPTKTDFDLDRSKYTSVKSDDEVRIRVKTKRVAHIKQVRNKRGRWESSISEGPVKSWCCQLCPFVTVTQWKLDRHINSNKHSVTKDTTYIDVENNLNERAVQCGNDLGPDQRIVQHNNDPDSNQRLHLNSLDSSEKGQSRKIWTEVKKRKQKPIISGQQTRSGPSMKRKSAIAASQKVSLWTSGKVFIDAFS